MLTGYDALALRYIRYPLAYGRIALASFIGYALSHNIGLSLFTGSAIRYRFYAAWGLSTAQIAGVVAFCTLTLWLGTRAIGGIAFLLTGWGSSQGAASFSLPTRAGWMLLCGAAAGLGTPVTAGVEGHLRRLAGRETYQGKGVFCGLL
jgi:uncharacterized membrane protein YbhN (UPF0104 family)